MNISKWEQHIRRAGGQDDRTAGWQDIRTDKNGQDYTVISSIDFHCSLLKTQRFSILNFRGTAESAMFFNTKYALLRNAMIFIVIFT